MVISANTGENVERSITVINKNDVPVTINMTTSGDLVKNLRIKDKTSFELNAGEEKKVYFTIKATEPGTTETRINILFIPAEGNGVGIPSVITFIASGENVTSENTDSGTDGSSGFSSLFSGQAVNAEGNAPNFSLKLSPLILLGTLTAILTIIFIALIIYSRKLNHKKRMGRFRVK
jgi:hypothetical protein